MSNTSNARDDRAPIATVVPFASAMECLKVQTLLRSDPGSLSEEECESIAAHVEGCLTCDLLLQAVCPDGSRGHPEPADQESLEARLERGILERLDRHSTGTEPSRVLIMMGAPAPSAHRPVGSVEGLEHLEAQLAPGQIIEGDASRFRIKFRMGHGDFTETYAADRLDADAARAVIKIPRVAFDMSDDAATERLTVLRALLGVYARELKGAVELRGAAHILDTGTYLHRLRGRSTYSTFVAYEFIEGDDLETYMHKHHAVADGRFCGLTTADEFARWARMLTMAVRELHDRLILHGDICPPNILVNRDGRPIFIDVGQSVFTDVMDGIEEFGASFYRAPERVATPSSDLFSLGAVMYYLATGKKPIGLGAFTDIEVLKRHVALKIKEANPRLYFDDAGVADVVAMCLRKSQRVQHAAHLLHDIDTFWPEARPNGLLAAHDGLRHAGEMLDRGGNSLFRSIASAKVRDLQEVLIDMAKGVFDISGSSKDIRNAAYSMVGALGEGDEFLALSLPCFWNPDNIGINGRFLSMNRNAAMRGARVRRIFLLEEGFSDRHLHDIVAAQFAVANDIELSRRANYGVRYLVVSAETRRQMLAGGKHFGLLIKAGDHTAMFPVYGENDMLVTLRFRSGPPHVDGLREIFETVWPRARPLVDLRLAAGGVDAHESAAG
ncbi:MAG TPA: protein kinase [Thermomicrobiales bacterium]|nr:protein kinase [Thermomicrobiales bacterium]